MNMMKIAENSLFLIDEHHVQQYYALCERYEQQLPNYGVFVAEQQDCQGKLNLWIQFSVQQLGVCRNMEKYFDFPVDYFSLDMLEKHVGLQSFLKDYQHFEDAAYILAHFVFQKLNESFIKIFAQASISCEPLTEDALLDEAQLTQHQLQQRKVIQALVFDMHHTHIFHEAMNAAARNAKGWMIAHHVQRRKAYL